MTTTTIIRSSRMRMSKTLLWLTDTYIHAANDNSTRLLLEHMIPLDSCVDSKQVVIDLVYLDNKENYIIYYDNTKIM